MPAHQKFLSKLTLPINTRILNGFLNQHKAADIRKTHLFEGRYENIYLDQQHIPELAILISEATDLAQKILKIQALRAGYWFNYMPPGSTTTLHTHDDDDELLSGVYYVHVPENSGNLIIYDNSQDSITEKTEITPHAGEFIFFKPDARHEVTKNLSAQHRLSIGMNFGCPDTD
ncbi:MAG: putative 2OG-Fe(II) oxygenase [Gammaproteobacteria bacterium]|nr:putative 2OG-Fe(II) oxygenase [Gammaproteobacteria bacterium]